MAEPYKLKDEIRQFIIDKKKINPKLSCRSITPLIKENFGVNLSKSSINAIIKGNNLSNKVGRPRIRQKVLPKPVELPLEPVTPKDQEIKASEPVKPVENTPKTQSIVIKSVRENGQCYYIENGGVLFLVIADQKSGMTDFIAGKLAAYLPHLSKEVICLLIRAQIYSQISQGKIEPWGLLGKELICAEPDFYYEQLNRIPLNQLDMDFFSLGLEHNINEISKLYKQCLFRLNSLVQTFFFPSVYQSLDFKTMFEWFYSLIAKIEVKSELIDTQLFYWENFKLAHDIIWQEDFKFVVNKINSEKLFAEGEQFRFDENIGPVDMKTVSFK